jgi:hypothetical protein
MPWRARTTPYLTSRAPHLQQLWQIYHPVEPFADYSSATMHKMSYSCIPGHEASWHSHFTSGPRRLPRLPANLDPKKDYYQQSRELTPLTVRVIGLHLGHYFQRENADIKFKPRAPQQPPRTPHKGILMHAKCLGQRLASL